MKIVIPDDYQDMIDQLECFSLICHHDVTRYREPARDLTHLVERLRDRRLDSRTGRIFPDSARKIAETQAHRARRQKF